MALTGSVTTLPSGRPEPEARKRIGFDKFSNHPSVMASRAGMAEEEWLCYAE